MPEAADRCKCVRCRLCRGTGREDPDTDGGTCEECVGSGFTDECRYCEQKRWDEEDE